MARHDIINENMFKEVCVLEIKDETDDYLYHSNHSSGYIIRHCSVCIRTISAEFDVKELRYYRNHIPEFCESRQSYE